MRTENIPTALKVAETGHFNTAARAMFMTDANAQMRILSLEQELGFKLFDRPKDHSNPLVPTLQGAKWLALARKALELLEQGKIEVRVKGRRPRK